MIEVLKQIILDFQSEVSETGTLRHLQYELVDDKVFICIGVRRCGKTTLLYQIIEKLKLQSGLKIENIIYINFFDDRLTELKEGKLQLILDAYFTLYPEKKNTEEIFFFFDEIQEVKDWEAFIERIRRTEKSRIFLTGSSARMLSREISTQMRGRSLAWELFPFSFTEFMDYHHCAYSIIDTKASYIIQSHFNDYFQQGGFPEVFDLSPKLGRMIHQEYYKSILHRDIIERYDISHPQAVIQLGYRLMTSVSNLFTINRLTEYIRNLGYKVPKSFVSDCVQWFEDAFFLFSICIYSQSINVQNTNPKKVYCVDHGLARSISPDIKQDEGYMLENIIFLHLRRTVQEIYYYRTRSGKEIDFIWNHASKTRILQVCFDTSHEDTMKREQRALVEAMQELNLNESIIITLNEEKTLEINGYKIYLIPAWRYLTVH